MPRSFTFATIAEYQAAKGNSGAIYAELVSSGIKSGSCVSKITATGDVFIDSINPFVTPELGQEGDTLYYSSTEGYRFLRAGNTTWDDQSYGQVYINLAKIPSGFSVVAPYTDIFNFKQTDENIGSGKASMTKILGNTVAWNQLLIIPSSSASKTESGVTTVDNRDGSYTVSTVAQGASANVAVNLQANFITGHKYLLKGCPQGGGDRSYVLYINSTTASGGYDFGNGTIATANLSNQVFFPRIYIYSGAIITTPIIFRPILIDLTLMFGEGKEPATVAEFEALYPKPYYAYNTGQLLSNKAKAIEFVGFNQWDEEAGRGTFSLTDGETFTPNSGYLSSYNKIPVIGGATYYFKGIVGRVFYYDHDEVFIESITRFNNPLTIPNNVGFIRFQQGSSAGDVGNICINLSGPRNGQYEPYKKTTLQVPITALRGKLNGQGNSVNIFPDGLKSAGDVCDEIRNGYAIKRGGYFEVTADTSLDAISLSPISVGAVFLTLDIPGAIGGRNLSNMYKEDITGTNATNQADGSVRIAGSTLCVKDTTKLSSGMTKVQVRTALIGLSCVYELETPEYYVLDRDFNWKYRVSEYHTKKMLPENGENPTSAPFVCEIKQI